MEDERRLRSDVPAPTGAKRLPPESSRTYSMYQKNGLLDVIRDD